MHKPFLYYISRIIALVHRILRVGMSWWLERNKKPQSLLPEVEPWGKFKKLKLFLFKL